jgi:hypothetical protein
VTAVTEDSAHHGPPDGDPARRGGTIGAGLVPDEVTEGRAETAAHSVGPQPHEGLVRPGGVDTGEPAEDGS